ncbi:MAG: chemotaxis protein, partial [Alphaproteobacteria bacterium]
LSSVRGMIVGVDGLSTKANDVSEVMSQAGSIATNIAIEASTAGVHEAEFEQVAITMREYVHQLREMIDVAGGSIRDAGSIGQSLQNRAQSNLD